MRDVFIMMSVCYHYPIYYFKNQFVLEFWNINSLDNRRAGVCSGDLGFLAKLVVSCEEIFKSRMHTRSGENFEAV